jgi:hypothetical protein
MLWGSVFYPPERSFCGTLTGGEQACCETIAGTRIFDRL